MSDLEITRVLYLTKTDSNGKLVLVSNIEVETYAYADYMDNDDDDIIDDPVDEIVPDGGIKSSQNNANAKARSGNELSRGAIIAVSVVVPLATIFILIGMYFLHKWWRRRRNAMSWDPKNETANLNNKRMLDEISVYDGAETEANPEFNNVAVPAPVYVPVTERITRDSHDISLPNYEAHGFENLVLPSEKPVAG
ncbi:hypothetical protein GGF37_001591 [Kickxella alabastrina]|nr:hypothetical protein GGF37_001591 [Kickxella alabastrina]